MANNHKDTIIHRKIYPVVPPKVEYSLTAHGRTLLPILKALDAWGETHVKKRSA